MILEREIRKGSGIEMLIHAYPPISSREDQRSRHEEGLPAERTILCEVAHTALPLSMGQDVRTVNYGFATRGPTSSSKRVTAMFQPEFSAGVDPLIFLEAHSVGFRRPGGRFSRGELGESLAALTTRMRAKAHVRSSNFSPTRRTRARFLSCDHHQPRASAAAATLPHPQPCGRGHLKNGNGASPIWTRAKPQVP